MKLDHLDRHARLVKVAIDYLQCSPLENSLLIAKSLKDSIARLTGANDDKLDELQWQDFNGFDLIDESNKGFQIIKTACAAIGFFGFPTIFKWRIIDTSYYQFISQSGENEVSWHVRLDETGNRVLSVSLETDNRN